MAPAAQPVCARVPRHASRSLGLLVAAAIALATAACNGGLGRSDASTTTLHAGAPTTASAAAVATTVARPPAVATVTTTVESVPSTAASDDNGPEQQALVLGTDALVERLRATRLLNGDEIHDLLGLESTDAIAEQASLLVEAGLFLTCNPFEPLYREPYETTADLRYPLPGNPLSYEVDEAQTLFSFYGQEPVLRWHTASDSSTEVCAVRFSDDARIDYELRTFSDEQSARAAGYTITHKHHCGTCSSLHNLAAYLTTPDLTTPARECARKVTPSAIKECFINEIGFDEPCAETWTYNALHTARHCAVTCAEYYGIEQMLSGNFDKPNTDEHGNLNPCLACDEFTSGPGFQYAAGRTRRSSGITSAIERSADEMYSVDHVQYFR